MQTRIEKVFPINAPADVAWRLLEDIQGIAGCMPGAAITEKVDASNYRGQVRVKLGPAAAAFAGNIEIKSMEPAKRQILLTGKGTDAKGGSAASMDLAAQVRAVDAGKCELVGNAEVILSGKLASFGGRMINQVSDQVLKQFGENFAKLAQSAVSDTPPAGEAAASAPAGELNLLALLRNIIVDFFRRLFGRRESRDTSG